MRSRLDLHEILCEILGSRNAYFQPPSSVLMKYPAIRYRRSDISNRHADNGVYSSMNQYELTLIDKDPDSDLVEKINLLPTARFVRQFAADNLNHWVFEIFY